MTKVRLDDEAWTREKRNDWLSVRNTSEFDGSYSPLRKSLLSTSPRRDRSCTKGSLRVGAYRTPVRGDRETTVTVFTILVWYRAWPIFSAIVVIKEIVTIRLVI